MKKLLEKLKNWWSLTALPFLKTNWMQIVNIIILFVAYSTLSNNDLSITEAIVGLWIFVLLGYYIFWKLFGAEKMFKK